MYEDFYDDLSQEEQTNLEILLEEFKSKTKDILTADINSEYNTIKTENERLIEQNQQLLEDNFLLKQQLEEKNKIIEDSKLITNLLNNIKQLKDDPNKIFQFLDCLYEKDFEEIRVQDTPLWIEVLTQYYSHKDDIIEFLKIIDVKLPNNISNFRLPIDWNEEEMDIFFNSMYCHYCTNGNIFERNLKWYGTSSLNSVKEQCRKNTSNIPWQYILRNPILKKEKYLRQIGKHLTDYSSNWTNFAKITKFLDLSDDEIKIIINNIDQVLLKKKTDAMDFCIRHLQLIDNEVILNKIYNGYYNSYDFKYNNKILEMPFDYIKDWIGIIAKEDLRNAVDFITNKCDNFSQEQYKELLEIAFKQLSNKVNIKNEK